MANVTEPNMKDMKKTTQNFSSYVRDASDTVEEAGHNIKDMAGKAGRTIRSLVENSREEITEAADHYKSAVRKNPVQASLLVLGAGVLLGLFLRK